MSASTPPSVHDPSRLRALRETGLLDSPPEEAFDRFATLASEVLNVPVAAVSLVDGDRQFLKSCVGVAEPWASRREMPLPYSFCQHALGSPGPLSISDARKDPRVSDSPAVQETGAIAYLGIPLITGEGHALGTLCVVDDHPREWTKQEIAILQRLAAAAITEIELRRQVRETEAAEHHALLAERERREKTALLESTTEGIYGIDAQGRCTFLNPAGAAMLGYTPDGVLGRNMHQLIHHHRPDGSPYPEAECPIRTAVVQGGSVRVEGEVLFRSDGSSFPAEYSSSPIREEGRIRGAVVTFQDITERKRAEAELAERARHEALGAEVGRAITESDSVREALQQTCEALVECLDAAFARIWTVNEAEQMLELQASAGRYTHLDGSHSRVPVGKFKIGLIAEERQPRLTNDVLTDPRVSDKEWARREGMVAFAGYPLIVETRLVGVIAMFARHPLSDSTLAALRSVADRVAIAVERGRSVLALRESERRQRFLAEASAALAAAALDYSATIAKLARLAVPALGDWCCIYTRHEDGRLEHARVAHADPARAAAAQRLEHYELVTAADQPVTDVMRTGEPVMIPDVPEELVRRFAQDAEHQSIVEELGIRSLVAVPLRARGRVLGALLLVSSSRERRYGQDDLQLAEEFAGRAALAIDNARLYAASQEANQVKSDFLATVSHELRTPLNAMVGYTDLMKEGIPKPIPPESLQYVERIALSARHLRQLIEEILSFTRLESGSERIRPEPVDSARLVEEVRAIVEPMASEKGLSFEVDAPEHPLQWESEQAKVRQILINLLDNAVKFTESGRVSLSIREEGEQVLLRVSDSGVGIEPEHQSRIFDTFWQVEQSSTRTAGGTGLGLSVVRRLVEVLGGTIRVASEHGQGTTFTVRLPKSHSRTPAAEAQNPD